MFYLKEKGNKIDHFDEKLIKFILFNDLNIIEKEEEDKIKVGDEIENSSKESNENISEEIKSNRNKKQEVKNINTKKKEEKTNENGNKEKIINKGKDNDIHKEEVNGKKEDKINEKRSQEKKIDEQKNDDGNKNIKVNLNEKYEGKTSFNGSELIEMLKNPFKFVQKNIITKNLFDSIYKQIDNLMIESGYKNKVKQMLELESECEKINSRIKKLMENIEEYIKIKYRLDIIDIENIKEINNNENNDLDLNEKNNMYLELIKINKKMNEKMNYLRNDNKKFKELNDSIANNEVIINELINKLKRQIQKSAELIKLSDLFEDYKSELKNNVLKQAEYQAHLDIFEEKKIDNFELNNLYKFLGTHLKNYYFFLTKRDITNYNLRK